VRSKADICQLNLPHRTKSLKIGKEKREKTKKRIYSEVSVNSPRNPQSQSVCLFPVTKGVAVWVAYWLRPVVLAGYRLVSADIGVLGADVASRIVSYRIVFTYDE